jgi:tetratricopeptide (TPR) repeat protein
MKRKKLYKNEGIQKNKSNKIESNKSLNFNSAEAHKKPRAIFYLVIVLIPVIFFVLLEISLRVFNYGRNTDQWFAITDKKLMLNPEIAHRYFFNIDNVPYSNEDLFDKVKAPNSFRIFVLGGSSAAGYPYLPIGSFSRFLQRRLQLLYPESKIEVVNLAMTAINSYSLRDMMPGVIEQKPDLILIYAGHNEYYGALGEGSVESFGSNTALVNTILYLNRFKTIELFRNTINSITKLFAGVAKDNSGTLMSRIVKNQYIPYGEETYKDGLIQFDENMHDILEMAKEHNVPVILGTLACNLKDQPPFISIKSKDKPGAKEIFQQAKTNLANGNYSEAKKLFIEAKDEDCLRFRASEDLNTLIKKLCVEYKYPVVKIDSAFNAASPEGIVGDNLMTDHLHPTIAGYELIGKLYYDEMKKSNLLPRTKPVSFDEHHLDRLTSYANRFTRLDSTIATDRIKVLKNDWPYIDRKDKKPVETLIKRNDFIDSLAMKVMFEEVTWEKAHRQAAQRYLNRQNISEFQNYMDVLIGQYPIIVEYYSFIANVFIKEKNYDAAYNYLLKGYEVKPDAFFSKWLGIIDLSKEKADQALKYLNESTLFDANDPQVLYNLAGAYVYKKDYSKALEIVNRCIGINPSFPDAKQLRAQLLAATAK